LPLSAHCNPTLIYTLGVFLNNTPILLDFVATIVSSSNANPKMYTKGLAVSIPYYHSNQATLPIALATK